LATSAQALLHSVKPELQVNVHAPPTQVGCALATLVEHTTPHAPQLLLSPVVSTQAPPQRVLALGGHPDTHEYAPASGLPAHRGVPPSGEHATPQAPQLEAVVN